MGCEGGRQDVALVSTTAAPSHVTPVTVLPSDDCGLPDFQNELLRQLNVLRASGLVCGSQRMARTSPVAWSDQLKRAASAHAMDMAAHNLTGHIGSDGSNAQQRQQRHGFFTKSHLIENVGSGYSTVADVMKGWRDSVDHCTSMMSPFIKQVAVSCVQNTSSKYGYYWAMEGGN
jgi:uncharacterized protein YkwD